ncbi:hypothetical protein PVAP13_9KG032495 [Panicum virgatum]|uniref:Uncharacterized protein n=1 Tax=Panicum virgatum TaxID=38727 RepID=A0A8T0NAQ8_PANVG|nr:hypothetical protein PVAP13_9KG032495 [Panicum virgatum]
MGWHGSGSRQGIEPATGAAAYFHRLVNVPAWPGCRPPLACPRRALGCNGKRKASPEGQAIGDGVFTARPPVPDLRRHGRLPLLAGGRRRSIGGGHQPSGGGGRQAEGHLEKERKNSHETFRAVKGSGAIHRRHDARVTRIDFADSHHEQASRRLFSCVRACVRGLRHQTIMDGEP